MFEIHSMGLSVFFRSVFIWQVLSERRCFILLLLLSCSLVCSLSHTHTCSAPSPNPSTYTHTGHPDLRSKHPTVAMGTISALSALLGSAWSEAICPLPILPSSPPPFQDVGERKKKKYHAPLSRGTTSPSPILSLRFIHPQCLAPATSSPPTLTPTLHSLRKCVCIHLLFPQTEREAVGGEQKE